MPALSRAVTRQITGSALHVSVCEFVRNPEFHLGLQRTKSERLEIRREHSDDRKVAQAGGYDFSQYMRISAIAAKPELVAEHDNFAVAELTVRGRDQSSQDRLCSESFQVAVLNPKSDQAFGLLFERCSARRRWTVPMCSNTRLRSRQATKLATAASCHPRGSFNARLTDHDKTIRVFDKAAVSTAGR